MKNYSPLEFEISEAIKTDANSFEIDFNEVDANKTKLVINKKTENPGEVQASLHCKVADGSGGYKSVRYDFLNNSAIRYVDGEDDYIFMTDKWITDNVQDENKYPVSSQGVYNATKDNLKKTDVVDNLTSTDTDKPLSANQGKALNDKFGSYIPKAGGDVNGALKFAPGHMIKQQDDTSWFGIHGGSNYDQGASLYLNGKGDNNGSWSIKAHNGSSGTELKGTYDGNLTWGDKEILTDGNSLSCDSTIYTDMTKNILFAKLSKNQVKYFSSVKFNTANSPTGSSSDEFCVEAYKESNASYTYGYMRATSDKGIYLCWITSGSFGEWRRLAQAEEMDEYVRLDGATMEGDLDMGSNSLTGIPNPTQLSDAANKNYVDTKAGNYLPLAGGTMSGEINMSTKAINNCGILSGNFTDKTLVLRTSYTNWKVGRVDFSEPNGTFKLQAGDGSNTGELLGNVDGTLKWNNKPVWCGGGSNVQPTEIVTSTGYKGGVIYDRKVDNLRILTFDAVVPSATNTGSQTIATLKDVGATNQSNGIVYDWTANDGSCALIQVTGGYIKMYNGKKDHQYYGQVVFTV